MRRDTLFLKIVLILIAFPVLVLSLTWLPWQAILESESGPIPDYALILILFFLYTTAIPFLFALLQTWKILNYIDKGIAFSELSVKAIKYIKYCALFILSLYLIALPFLYYIAEQDDAPGVFALGLIVAFACVIVSVFASVFYKLLKNAIDIKTENDLTV